MQANNATLIICLLFVAAMVALNIVATAAHVSESPLTISSAVAGVVAVVAALFVKKPGS